MTSGHGRPDGQAAVHLHVVDLKIQQVEIILKDFTKY
jgi:hypothetical protein